MDWSVVYWPVTVVAVAVCAVIGIYCWRRGSHGKPALQRPLPSTPDTKGAVHDSPGRQKPPLEIYLTSNRHSTTSPVENTYTYIDSTSPREIYLSAEVTRDSAGYDIPHDVQSPMHQEIPDIIGTVQGSTGRHMGTPQEMYLTPEGHSPSSPSTVHPSAPPREMYLSADPPSSPSNDPPSATPREMYLSADITQGSVEYETSQDVQSAQGIDSIPNPV